MQLPLVYRTKHPTAEEVFYEAKKLDPKISRATVYRNLAILSEEGEIKHYNAPFGSDHYDSKITPHYHCLCRKCGKLFDTKVKYLKDLDDVNLGVPDFELESHDLIFIGTCSECEGK